MSGTQIVNEINLYDVFNGKYVNHEILRKSICNLCDGTGFIDKIVRVCKKCRGRKTLSKKSGNTIISQNCEFCSGSGLNMMHNKCVKCLGTRMMDEMFKLKYLIPIGINNGDEILIKNVGDIIIGNNTRKDIIIKIKINNNTSFKMKHEINDSKLLSDHDLYYEMNLPLINVYCGIHKNILLPDNNILKLTIPSIDPKNLIHIEENYGLPTKNKKSVRGRLLIKFNIMFPQINNQDKINKLHDILYDTNFNDF